MKWARRTIPTRALASASASWRTQWWLRVHIVERCASAPTIGRWVQNTNVGRLFWVSCPEISMNPSMATARTLTTTKPAQRGQTSIIISFEGIASTGNVFLSELRQISTQRHWRGWICQNHGVSVVLCNRPSLLQICRSHEASCRPPSPSFQVH